jgi:hypothetical protein
MADTFSLPGAHGAKLTFTVGGGVSAIIAQKFAGELGKALDKGMLPKKRASASTPFAG